MSDVIERLESIGYQVTDDDEWAIGFCTVAINNLVQAECGRVPEELDNAITDAICAKFLSDKIQSGSLHLEDIDLEAVSSLSIGGTSITYDKSTSGYSKVAGLIAGWANELERLLPCYRTILF